LRSEQRLQHEGAAPQLTLRYGPGHVAGLGGPGARDGNPGPLQEKGRGRLVDAALDDAGIVPHHDTKLAQGMKDPEPARHRLE
jgi:hypothetical protein